jgi:hypothetical protein
MPSSIDYFDRYARNLEAVKAHPQVRLQPDLNDAVLCPQCFKVITREDLNDPNGQFTLEHVPPEALGGTIQTFTCRDCNSWAGHYLDSHLLNWLRLRDFLQMKPGSSVDAQVTIGDEVQVTSELVYAEDGGLQILADLGRSDPSQMEQANRMMKGEPPKINLKFSGRKGRGARRRRPEAALLRIAYLYAFSVFGYGFLINFGSKAIRSQFRKPEEEILPAWGISQNDSFPDKALGINIITAPNELRSFIVIFDLKYESNQVRYSVLIPGPTSPGADIYHYLAARIDTQTAIQMELVPIPIDQDYIGKPETAFIFHDFWKFYKTSESGAATDEL